MPIEVRITISEHPIATLVVSRVAPHGRLELKEGVGTYTATLHMIEEQRTITLEGIKHVRADGAISLIRRCLNEIFGWEYHAGG